MLLPGLGGRPVLHEHEAAWITLVDEEFVTKVALFLAGWLDHRDQIAAQFVLLALLCLEADDDE